MYVVDWVGVADEVDGGGEWRIVMEGAITGKGIDLGADWTCDVVRYLGIQALSDSIAEALKSY